MYTEFYGLTGQPFQLTPDPRFYFASSGHARAMAHLTYGVHQGEGFIVITGDVGAGKTTLVGHLLSKLDKSRFVAANVVTTQLGPAAVLRMVASAFNIQHEGVEKATLLRRIESFLVDNHAHGRRCLLMIDEAQNLSPQALEELRMLSNFQVDGQAPLQSFLLGQPQFRRTLASRDLDQLRQRIIASYHLGPMNAEETAEYIRHRLRAVGWRNDPEIDDDAFHEIYEHTGGVPRRINVLCSRLLLFGFLEEQHHLRRRDVVQVAADLDSETEQILDHTEPVNDRRPARPAAAPAAHVKDTDLPALRRRVEVVEGQVQSVRRALQFTIDYLDGGSSNLKKEIEH